jgi:two-component system, cell cycle sensor histidine kinase and response regulator CckA
MGMSDWPTSTERVTAQKFAAIYVVWSAVWVIGSDYVMHLAVRGPSVQWKIESYKFVVHILVTGLILFFAVRDRDRKHRAECARVESMLRSLRRCGLLGIYEWQSDGSIVDANTSLLDAMGYTRKDLATGKLTREAVTPPEYWEADRIADEQMLSRGRSHLYEKEVIRKDGVRLQALVGRALLEGYKDRGIGYAIDITETKQLKAKQAQLEHQLLQSEKLNALGQLAGGIAHDFNNLLSIIIGYTSLTESKLGIDSSVRENTTQVLKAAESAKNLIRKLLAFSRKQVLNPELLSLNELISELSGMLTRVLDERVKLELRLGPKVGNIEADRSQIEQSILNLVVNARDAMPHGGVLTIDTFSASFPQDRYPDLEGEYDAIRVTDTGSGIDDSVRLRIFEPFFTTKQESGGTGLGLATVYGIVKQSGGHIDVESKLGEGSSFTMYFPTARSLKIVERPRGPVVNRSSAGSETILLIEDLSELREMIANILRSKGYQVLQARDGVDAVNLAASHFAPIDLIVTDVIMPKLNGPEAVRQIRARRPSVKAIYITGYSNQTISDEEFSSNSVTVEKPIRPDTLLAKVRELLDQDGSANTESRGHSLD